jgi:hypothetical protein
VNAVLFLHEPARLTWKGNGSVTQHLDDLSRAYVDLAFGIERHYAGVVDAWLGPAETRDAAMAGPAPRGDDLVARATRLRVAVEAADLPMTRIDYLSAQVRALETLARAIAGETFGYRDEVAALFDIEPQRTPERVYEESLRALDDALPGTGDIAGRMIAWRAQFEMPLEAVQGTVDRIVAEVRRRAAAFAPLPEGEGVEIALVSDKPWGGYNWYLGNCRSLVEVNTDMPVRANALLDLMCHEGYPGHHTEHALKEQRLYLEQGFGEHAIQLINTPECVIAEGIATLAESIIFAPGEAEAWQAEHVYAPLGITVDPARDRQIADAQRTLRSVSGNVALLVHEDGAAGDDAVRYLMRYGLESEERARHRMRFITDPLWRPYVFTYHVGRDLLGAWIELPEGDAPVAEGDRFAHRQRRFARLLVEQMTPSRIAADVAEDEEEGPGC